MMLSALDNLPCGYKALRPDVDEVDPRRLLQCKLKFPGAEHGFSMYTPALKVEYLNLDIAVFTCQVHKDHIASVVPKGSDPITEITNHSHGRIECITGGGVLTAIKGDLYRKTSN